MTVRTLDSISNPIRYAPKQLNLGNQSSAEGSFYFVEQINLEDRLRQKLADETYQFFKHYYIQHSLNGKCFVFGNYADRVNHCLFEIDYEKRDITRYTGGLPDDYHISHGVSCDDGDRFIYLGLGHDLSPDGFQDVNKLYKFDTVTRTYTLVSTVPLGETPHLGSAVYWKGYIYVAYAFESAHSVTGLPITSSVPKILKINAVTGEQVLYISPYTTRKWGKPRLSISADDVLYIYDGFLGYDLTHPSPGINLTPILQDYVKFDLPTNQYLGQYSLSNTVNLTGACQIDIGDKKLVVGGNLLWHINKGVNNYTQLMPPNFVILSGAYVNDVPAYIYCLDSNKDFSNQWNVSSSNFYDFIGIPHTESEFLGAGAVGEYWGGQLVFNSANDYCENVSGSLPYSEADYPYNGQKITRFLEPFARVAPTLTYLGANFITDSPESNLVGLNNDFPSQGVDTTWPQILGEIPNPPPFPTIIHEKKYCGFVRSNFFTVAGTTPGVFDPINYVNKAASSFAVGNDEQGASITGLTFLRNNRCWYFVTNGDSAGGPYLYSENAGGGYFYIRPLYDPIFPDSGTRNASAGGAVVKGSLWFLMDTDKRFYNMSLDFTASTYIDLSDNLAVGEIEDTGISLNSLVSNPSYIQTITGSSIIRYGNYLYLIVIKSNPTLGVTFDSRLALIRVNTQTNEIETIEEELLFEGEVRSSSLDGMDKSIGIYYNKLLIMSSGSEKIITYRLNNDDIERIQDSTIDVSDIQSWSASVGTYFFRRNNKTYVTMIGYYSVPLILEVFISD